MRKFITIIVLIVIGITFQSCCCGDNSQSDDVSYNNLNYYIGDEVLDTLPISDTAGKILYYKYIINYRSEGKTKGRSINVKVNEHFWKPGDVISFDKPFKRDKMKKSVTTNNKFVE